MIYSFFLAGKVEENTQKCTDMTTVAKAFYYLKHNFLNFVKIPRCHVFSIC